MVGKSKLYLTGIAAIVAIVIIVLLTLNSFNIAPTDTHGLLSSDEIGFAVQSVRAAGVNNPTPRSNTNACTGAINRSCTIHNGEGIQYRTCSKNHWSSWSDCKIVTCDSGYVTSGNDRSGYKCVKYTCPKYPTLQCDGGTIIPGTINSKTGCQGRPRCVINTAVSTCNDSDDGQNYIQPGTVSGTTDGNPYSYSDYCNADQKTLNEYYCIKNGFSAIIAKNCPNGCVDGACIQNITIVPVCTDSDGIDYYKLGTVNITFPVGSSSAQDVCGSQDGGPANTGYVIEYTCNTHLDSSGNIVHETSIYKCPYGCSNGACITSPPSPNNCSATYNSCITNVQIAGCRQGGVGDCAIAFQNCQNAFNMCQNLTSNNICTDSDGGNNIYVYGTVTNGSYGGYDCCAGETGGCTDNNTGYYIFEQSCLNGGVVNTKYACPNGCLNGACIKVPCPQYSIPSPDWCINGTVTPGTIDQNGCQGPPICGIHACLRPACYSSYDTGRKDSYGCPIIECNVSDGTCYDTDPTVDMYTKGVINNQDNSSLVSDVFNEGDSNGLSLHVLDSSSANMTLYNETETVHSGETVHFALADLRINNIQFFGLGNSTNKLNYDVMSVNDFCSATNALIEYYCDTNKQVTRKDVSCPNGCSNGVCLNQYPVIIGPVNYTLASHSPIEYNNKTIQVYGFSFDSVVIGVDNELASFKEGDTKTVSGTIITVNTLSTWTNITYGLDYRRYDFVRLNVTNLNNMASNIVEFNSANLTKTIYGKSITYLGASTDATKAIIYVDGSASTISVNTSKTISGLKIYLKSLSVTETGTQTVNYDGLASVTLSTT